MREHHQPLPDDQLHREGFTALHLVSELLATPGALRRVARR
nr:hypothetical protein [Streptomyces sp. DSM 41633]